MDSIKVTIEPMELEVKADQQTKFVGDPDPKLTWKCLTRLAWGDRLTGTLTRKKGEKVGQYRIKIDTLTAGSNYKINFKGSWLVIRNPVTPPPTQSPAPTAAPNP